MDKNISKGKNIRYYFLILIVLFFVDLFISGELSQITFLKIISYTTKTFIGVLVLSIGLKVLLTKPLSKILRLVIFIYICIILSWLLIWVFNWNNIQLVTLLINPSYSFFTWFLILLIPISTVLPQITHIFIKISKINIIFPLIILIVTYFINSLFDIHLFIVAPSVFLIFIVSCHSTERHRDLFIITTSLITLSLIMLSSGYRIYALASLVLIIFIVVKTITKKPLILPFITISLLLPFIYHFFITTYLEQVITFDSTMFIDTRTFLFIELINDMSIVELFFGKGLLGTYYSHYFYNLYATGIQNGDYFMRSGSEVGWLNIVLKFGIFGLSLNLFLIIYPLIKISFKTKNKKQQLVDKLVTFSLIMFFIFIVELPASINFSYVIWYATIGILWRTVKTNTS